MSMALLSSVGIALLAFSVGSAFLISYMFDYFVTNRQLIDIPGPFLAKHTRAWLAMSALNGRMNQAVHDAHKKYGKIVRIQPNFVSVSDDSALPLIYGQGSKLIKSDFYDVFAMKNTNILATRSRPEHARRRRFVAHAFSSQSLSHFEPYISAHIKSLLQRLDEVVACQAAKIVQGVQITPVDVMPWFNYQTFDVISDLVFGRSLNMLQRGCDIAEMRLSLDGPTEYHPAIDPIDKRSKVNAAMGFFPPMRVLMSYPLTTAAQQAKIGTQRIAGMAYACVKYRMENPSPQERKDILYRMTEERDEKGLSLSLEEAVEDSFALLIAGSDTTAHTLAMICFYLANNPQVLAKLEAEIIGAVPEDTDIPSNTLLQTLPYLDAVIKETLRLHSLAGIPIPREIPADSAGLEICGHLIPPGTVVAVPSYTVHHSAEIWGSDVEDFKPDRWKTVTPRQKAAFTPFSIGSRACVGRSLAELELRVTTAAIVKRYALSPGQSSVEFWESGFLRKADGVKIFMEKKRNNRSPRTNPRDVI